MFPNQIDRIYYINLDFRYDRKEHFLSWITKYDDLPKNKIHRISAIYDAERGFLGCIKSHIKTLETFLANSDENICLIFEDDFYPISSKKEIFWQEVNQIFENNVDFDLIMLSYNTPNENLQNVESFSFLKYTNFSYTTSSYMITRKFAPLLLECFQEALTLCENEIKKNSTKPFDEYYLDVYWNKLMSKTEKWYCFYPKLGKQYENYSDILKKVVDYDC